MDNSLIQSCFHKGHSMPTADKNVRPFLIGYSSTNLQTALLSPFVIHVNPTKGAEQPKNNEPYVAGKKTRCRLHWVQVQHTVLFLKLWAIVAHRCIHSRHIYLLTKSGKIFLKSITRVRVGCRCNRLRLRYGYVRATSWIFCMPVRDFPCWYILC